MSELIRSLSDQHLEPNPEDLRTIKTGEFRQASQEMRAIVNSQDLQFTRFRHYSDHDILNSALVAAGEKPGSMFGATLPNNEPLAEQLEALNDMGVDCYVLPDTTVVEGQSYQNHRVYITSDRRYRNQRGEELPFADEVHEDHYGLGEFFGFPQTEVENFMNRDVWPQGFEKRAGRAFPTDYEPGSDYMFPAETLASAHELDDDTYRLLDSLVSYTIADNQESLDKAVETAEKRFQALENLENDYGVRFTHLV